MNLPQVLGCRQPPKHTWCRNGENSGRWSHHSHHLLQDISQVCQHRRLFLRHTRLNPDQSVDQGVVSGGSRTSPKAGILDIAPLAPFGSDREPTSTTLVDDKVGREPLGREEGGKGIDIVGFVPRVAPLSEVLTWNGNVSCTVVSQGNYNTRHACTYSCSWRR